MNFKIKRQHFLLPLGAAATAFIPVVATVACGESDASPEDIKKVDDVKALFTSQITTQKITETLDYALNPGERSASEINALTGLTQQMPAVSTDGVNVIYTAAAINNLTQVITVKIEAGSAKTSLNITLTYGGAATMTDTAKMTAVVGAFTNGVTTQTLTTKFDDALAAGSTDATTINKVLVSKLPVRIPYGAKITYDVAAVDAATLVQTITANITVGSEAPQTVHLNLTYPGVTLAAFKALYPGKITDDGTGISDNAFKNYEFPPDFTLPQTVTSIGRSSFDSAKLPNGFTLPKSLMSFDHAFTHATLPVGFAIPPLVKEIGISSFYDAHLPVGFTIPNTVSKISSAAFYGAFLPDGFALPPSINIEDGAFEHAHFSPGFTIPINAILVLDYASKGPFKSSHIPDGYVWRDAQGNVIANQNDPTVGCVVAPITP